VFEPPARWLGRNMYCPGCGVRMTARPVAADAEISRREREPLGGPGLARPRLPLAVLVDNVRSLWNVGSIFRTADACGVELVVLCGITGSPPRPEIAKTSLGAEEAVAWVWRADALRALAELRGRGFVPVGLEPTPRAVDVDGFDWPARACLVVGNEVAGIAPAVLEACERHVAIPMRGIKQSLNVAVAFGIAAHRAAASLAPVEESS